MRTVYMLTVIYTGGKVIDIEFDVKEDRRDFFKCIRDTECRFTLWEKEVIET